MNTNRVSNCLDPDLGPNSSIQNQQAKSSTLLFLDDQFHTVGKHITKKTHQILRFDCQLSLDKLKINQARYYYRPNSVFRGRLSMESQPQNPEFKNNPENFHLCDISTCHYGTNKKKTQFCKHKCARLKVQKFPNPELLKLQS